MTEFSGTEADTVQYPKVHQAAEIGWVPLSPQEAREKRDGVDGMFFRAELETKLALFNPWMSADAIRQIREVLR